MSEQLPDSIQNHYDIQPQPPTGLLVAGSRDHNVYSEHPHPADAGYVLEPEPAGDEKQRGIVYTETELSGKPFVIAERPGSRKEELEAEAAAAAGPEPQNTAEPEPQPSTPNPEPAQASSEQGASSQPEKAPKAGEPIIFGKMAAGVRRVAEQYSAEGTELTSEDLSEDTPMLIRTQADENGVVGIYFAPKGLVDGAVIDMTKTIDQGKLVYLTPAESHVEDGKLVGDGPSYSPDAPYPSMTIGQPWHAGSELTQPIESVQISKGFLHEVPSHRIPEEQRGGPEIFDPLLKYVNDLKRAENAPPLSKLQLLKSAKQIKTELGLEFPEPKAAVGGSEDKSKDDEPEPEPTIRQRLAEKLGGVADGAGYMGRLALIEAAYHAGNIADRVAAAKDRMSEATARMAGRSKIFRNGRAENLANLTRTVDYLGNIALIETAYRAGNAKDSAAYHAGNVTGSVYAFIRDRLRRSGKSGKEASANADASSEEGRDELDVDLVSRQNNWDWGPDPGFEWEDNWGR